MILERSEWGDPEAPPLVCVHGVGSHAGSSAASRPSGGRGDSG